MTDTDLKKDTLSTTPISMNDQNQILKMPPQYTTTLPTNLGAEKTH
jgi:hypothetical protein